MMDESMTPSAAAVAVSSGSPSAVSWGAILAGAAVAVATSLVLFAIATGLDLASSHNSPGGEAAVAAIALVVTQWISAALAGYVTGRLRTRWIGTHTHEVFFRDTAHGLITWCVATIFLATGLVAAASAGAGVHVHTASATVFHPRVRASYLQEAAVGQSGAVDQEVTYERDPERTDSSGTLVLPRATMRATPALPAPLLTAHTVLESSRATAFTDPQELNGMSLARPSDVQLRGGDDSDTVRKDAALTSLLTALSMLVGAFIACITAAIGGRLRDLHP
jgi:hypothetical protein